MYAVPWTALGLDTVVFRRNHQEQTLVGRLLVTAQDGGVLLLGRDGVLWAIQPSEQIKITSNEAPFHPLSREELAAQLLRVLPAGFQVHETTHYLVCYNTSRGYAQWAGALLERLFSAFLNYWQRRGLELAKPEFPLVVIVFADRKTYEHFSGPELGEAAPSIVAYYSLMSNRITMYDLTGLEQFAGPTGSRSRLSPNQINQILARPEAERTVATIVHEATHQIAFNCGLHQRLSDCPLWVSEGIAIYFETPDLSSDKGWRSIGAINRPRLIQFYTYLKNRPPDSLRTLIEKDDRFRNTQTGLDAYAEAWALTYFLLKQRPKQYVEYLRQISRKKPLVWDSPQTRLREFQAAFGSDVQALDAEFLRFMAKLR
ncbi:MAG: DUF1570 domain-containing protein [Thermoguttaceae bacterium]|nr:DUF1570 domain-containing protein [Thermoguttaceae bacterium]MDW8038720.1 DUF1570 domain-containing protein [Thermoguttaceae bacterium]